ncbi:MAG: hypothetical protein ACBR15_10645 [Microcoleus sp.]
MRAKTIKYPVWAVIEMPIAFWESVTKGDRIGQPIQLSSLLFPPFLRYAL